MGKMLNDRTLGYKVLQRLPEHAKKSLWYVVAWRNKLLHYGGANGQPGAEFFDAEATRDFTRRFKEGFDALSNVLFESQEEEDVEEDVEEERGIEGGAGEEEEARLTREPAQARGVDKGNGKGKEKGKGRRKGKGHGKGKGKGKK